MTDTSTPHIEPFGEIPTFMTAQQVARLLKVRQSKVAAWLRSGELRGADLSERPGRGRARWRITRADLMGFLAGRQPSRPAEKSRRRRPAKPAGWVQYVKR
jgi:excisionase family DNA binding protein